MTGLNNSQQETIAWVLVALCLLGLVLFSGCKGVFRDSKPRYDFPSWCSAECHGALNEALALITSVDDRPYRRKSLRVEVRAGERKFKDGWGVWIAEPSWPNGGEWVGGLTSGNGKLITMVIDPARMGDASALHHGSLVHEAAHHWQICNGYGSDHDQKFDGVIPGWAEARRIMGKSAVSTVKAGRSYRIGPDGTHYDLIGNGGGGR